MPYSIVHLISSLHVGGAEMMLYKLLSRMDRGRFEPTVVCLTEIGLVGDKIRALGVPVHSLGMRRGQPSPLGLWRLLRLLKQTQPLILQTWLYHADLLGLIGGKLAGVPVVVWNLRTSNMDMRHYRRLSAWTLRACARLSSVPTAVMANSEFGRDYHARLGYHPRRWVLISNGLDLENFKPDDAARVAVRKEIGLASDVLLIGLVARFDPVKDHATFLRAAGHLRRKHPEVHFLLVGGGVTLDNADLTGLIAEQHLNGHVHLLGARTDMPCLTAALDIATLCSAYGEGFPNVVGEAMACGVPCVVTDVGDAAQIVGDTGTVVAPRDPAALATAWRKLIRLGTEGRQWLGRAARERIRRHNDLREIVLQYEDLYLSLVGLSARTTSP